jgi:hypothetical protein
MTNIPPEYKLTKEEIRAAFDGDFGEVHFDHKPTPEEILLIKLGLIADAAVVKAMPLIEKRAREEVVEWIEPYKEKSENGRYYHYDIPEGNLKAQLKVWGQSLREKK